jgi:hypothetical protein
MFRPNGIMIVKKKTKNCIEKKEECKVEIKKRNNQNNNNNKT